MLLLLKLLKVEQVRWSFFILVFVLLRHPSNHDFSRKHLCRLPSVPRGVVQVRLRERILQENGTMIHLCLMRLLKDETVVAASHSFCGMVFIDVCPTVNFTK